MFSLPKVKRGECVHDYHDYSPATSPIVPAASLLHRAGFSEGWRATGRGGGVLSGLWGLLPASACARKAGFWWSWKCVFLDNLVLASFAVGVLSVVLCCSPMGLGSRFSMVGGLVRPIIWGSWDFLSMCVNCGLLPGSTWLDGGVPFLLIGIPNGRLTHSKQYLLKHTSIYSYGNRL